MPWAIQVGLYDGDPILLGADGHTTMRSDQAKRFASKADAERHATGMRCSWHAIDLEALEHEQRFTDNGNG